MILVCCICISNIFINIPNTAETTFTLDSLPSDFEYKRKDKHGSIVSI